MRFTLGLSRCGRSRGRKSRYIKSSALGGLKIKKLNRLLAPIPGIKVYSYAKTNLEITSDQNDKGTAIQAAAAQLGISLEQVLGVGDSLNDMEMFNVAALKRQWATRLPR